MPIDQMSWQWAIAAIIAFTVIAACLLLFYAPALHKSKSGRIEMRRLVVAQIFIISAVVLPAFLGSYIWALVLGGLWSRGLWEIIELQPCNNIASNKIIRLACLICMPIPLLLMFVPIFCHGIIWLGLCMLTPIILARETAFKIFFPLLLLCLAVESLLLLGHQKNGFLVVAFLYFVVETFDSFAYLIGRFFGSHKAFPQLSPSKTWEGYAGGLLFALTGAVGFNVLVFKWDWWEFTLTWGLALIAGIGGDLITSWYKREQDRKDFNPLMSLHGGIIDIYDSLLFGAIALAAVYFI
jgi:phosphatidate cytidylyltransferase